MSIDDEREPRSSHLEGAPTVASKSALDEVADSTSDPELAVRLHELLSRASIDSPEFEAGLRELETRHEAAVYAELIDLLSHLRFAPAEAKQHWRRIVEHRGLMQERLSSFVDFRVALTSYFVQVNRQLDNPVIIEMRLFQRAQALAYRDELTGLRNYRFFSEALPQEVLRSDQYNAPLSLIMIDIDDFKNYNDRNGHAAGNRALTEIGRLLAGASRKVDMAARYGGEEFAMIAPSTTKIGARLMAERARRSIERHRFEGEERQPGGRLTVSLGIATYPADARDAAELVRRADRAMYHAKTGGKNRVQLYGEDRRSHRRVDVALDGSFSLYADDAHRLTTINISEGGIRFQTDRPVTLGALMDVSLRLPGSSHQVSLVGRVIKIRDGEAEGRDAALRIIDIAAPDRRLLAQYIRKQPEGESGAWAEEI